MLHFPRFSSRHGMAAALAAMAALSGPLHAQAAGFVDLAGIDREVAAFTGKSIGQQGGATMPIDRRLRLAACYAPLSLSWQSPRHDIVAVTCPDPGSWHVYVPVRAAEVGAVAIARGESVSIQVVGEGFSVSQPGEAMDAGAVGDWIRVRGLRDGAPRGEPIRARISRPGEVEVPLRD
ncbi:MAG TPA: flagella basal body P-ring formation protein FlgA [Novosphingobium sp.]|nr:flagella basal body P-ring formation protein FlgA [Novosphingobium sp.]